MFQHTAARRRLAQQWAAYREYCKFQHTAARRRLDLMINKMHALMRVSTHSRPKAAGWLRLLQYLEHKSFQHTAARRRLVFSDGLCLVLRRRFNTQPPEGGWLGIGSDDA